MSLKETDTMIQWNEAYLSKRERETIFCPNCGQILNKECSYSIENAPKNGSNMYECFRCGDVAIIFFNDGVDYEPRINFDKIRPIMWFLSGLFLGLSVLLTTMFYGLF